MRSDMPMWIIMKQNPATAETGAVWNSMLLRPELSAWQKKSLQLPVRTVFSGDAEEISAKAVLDAFKENDPVAVATMEKVGEQLGGALAIICCVTDPETIVIGGGVSKAGQPLIDCIRKYYREYAFESCKDTPYRDRDTWQ